MSALPTTPHPSDRRRRRWSRTALVALLVVLVAELAVRHLEPNLPAPDLWADEATATKATQLDHLRTEGCVDVVFAGNSMTRDALDPETFTASDPKGATAYNAALDAASPELLRSWVTREVVPAAKPGTVVIGLASFDLSDGASITGTARDAYQAAPLSASGPANDVEAWFVRNVALVRNRVALRSPEAIADSVWRWRDGDAAARPSPDGIPGVLAPDGHGLSRREQRYRPGASSGSFVRRELLDDFELGGTQAEELQRLIADLREDGIDVALLMLPVTPEYTSMHPHGARDQAAFEQLVTEIGQDTGVPVVRGVDPGIDGFADTHHLNGDGADEVTAALPEQLRSAGLTLPRC